MQKTLERTISGVAFLLIFLGALLCSPWVFAAFFTVIAVGMSREYFKLTVPGPRYRKEKICVVAAVALLVAASFLKCIGGPASAALAPVFSAAVLCVIMVFVFMLFDCCKDYDLNMHVFFPLLYVAIPFCAVMPLSFNITPEGGYSCILLLSIFIMAWTNDVSAYVFGMLFGQRPSSRKLFPALSPKKSWAGFVGGTAMCFVAAFVLWKIWGGDIIGMQQIWHWLALAAIVSIFGVFGDLFESLVKRHAQVKDSGNVIPGHGGLMDRFDDIMFILPLAYAYLKIFEIV